MLSDLLKFANDEEGFNVKVKEYREIKFRLGVEFLERIYPYLHVNESKIPELYKNFGIEEEERMENFHPR